MYIIIPKAELQTSEREIGVQDKHVAKALLRKQIIGMVHKRVIFSITEKNIRYLNSSSYSSYILG